jgi:23S rRNA pseudouridine1911/1915/1917 synthase
MDKPALLHSVQSGPAGGDSVADLLLEAYPQLSEVAPKKGDAGLVQRLDFSTSGLLIGAKSRESWLALHEQLLNGKILKSYVALVHGTPADNSEITTFIGSPYRHPKKMRVYESAPPKNHRALIGNTSIRLLEPIGQSFSLVQAFASPARRHQIRIHCAHISHTLVGDALYGSSADFRSLLGIDRDFFLHAAEIEFCHPRTSVTIAITSPYEEPAQLFRSQLPAH